MIADTLTIINSLPHVRGCYLSDTEEFRVIPRKGTVAECELAAYYTDDENDACETAQFLNNRIETNLP